MITTTEVLAPGFHIREELKTREMSQSELARRMDRPIQVINQIVNGTKSITADTALDLQKVLGVSAETWLNLDSRFRLHKAQQNRKAAKRAKRILQAQPVTA